MKSEIDIIIETAKHYNSYNRAERASDSICTYLNESGDMCAVGRCLSEEGMKLFKKFEDHQRDHQSFGDSSVQCFIDHHGRGDFENALKEEYRGHGTVFWTRLQKLHDTLSNWDKNGITERGLDNIDLMFGHNAYTMVKEALGK